MEPIKECRKENARKEEACKDKTTKAEQCADKNVPMQKNVF
jgi:hypothetical protein